MFKKEKDREGTAVEDEPAKDKTDETAYEDSWYRSLKALSELNPEDEETVESSGD